MVMTVLSRLVVVAAAVGVATGGVAGAAAAAPLAPNWPGEDMPLPLSVRTPQDLAVKALAERQYLLFNLLAGGKHAYDSGNFAVAAAKWESLLHLPGLDLETDRIIRPLAVEARARAGGRASAPLPPPLAASMGPDALAPVGEDATSSTTTPAVSMPGRGARGFAVSGTVTGGGTLGPGGTVLWLKRVDGRPTPRPAPARGKVISQRNKTFIPRVLAVPVGSKIDFRNEDDLFHNVFSLSRPNDFDTGLYRQGASYSQTFRKAGVVQLLCNIHSSMIAYVYVVDTPYYTQADTSGAFTIKNVPPGEYELATWHESSSRSATQKISVGAENVRGLGVKVAGDKAAPAFVPDKSGKPRQAHLGY